jgi:hypothetical protein
MVPRRSFLSLGPDSDPGYNSGQVGKALERWSSKLPLTLGQHPGPLDDFSLFWMDPDLPDKQEAAWATNKRPLIAQLTLPEDQSWFVQLGLQGRSGVRGGDPIAASAHPRPA